MQITYQKRDGNIIHRLRETDLPYKIGDTTSMGWKVLNIEYEYNNKFYSQYNYNILINKNKQLFLKKKQAIESFKVNFKTFIYYFIAVLLINFLKMMIGM